MNVPELVSACAAAVLAGHPITLTLPKGARWPHGWPRGELLSVNVQGDRNVSFDAVRVLAWVQNATRSMRAIHGSFEVTPDTAVVVELAVGQADTQGAP